MSQLLVCPSCHVLMQPMSTNQEDRGGDQSEECEVRFDSWSCRKCEGVFRRLVAETESGGTVPVGTPSETQSAVLESGQPQSMPLNTKSCPACLLTMTQVDNQETGQSARSYRCPGCHGEWTDGHHEDSATGESDTPGGNDSDQSTPQPESPLAGVMGTLLYGASLPERLIRSSVGMAAGTVRELAEFAVPASFKDSKSYEIAIRNSLGFLTETVGGVESTTSPVTDGDLGDASEHVARKAVGNFLDLAGLATLHVSPLWLMAVVSDVAYGSKTYTLRLAEELQKQGVIDDTSTIHRVDDLLDSIQRAAGTAATTIDRPPLSVDDLQKSLSETRRTLQEIDVRSVLPETEMQQIWTEMQTTARQQNVSLLGMSTAMTMNTVRRIEAVGKSTWTGIRVAGELLEQNVLEHYTSSLARIRDEGLFEMVKQSYAPYVQAVWNNMSMDRRSWTEELLDPNNIRSAIGKAIDSVSSLLGTEPSNPPDKSDEPQDNMPS